MHIRNFQTHNLSSTLTPYVESIFHYKNFVPDHSIERVVPTGHVFVLFELDGFTRSTFDNETLKENATFSKVWISGMHRKYLSISAHENSEMLVIQFKPHGSYPFIHIENDSVNERVVPGGAALVALREEVLNASSVEDKFAHVDSWLEQSFDDTKAPPKTLIEFISLLQTHPAAKLNSLVDAYSNTQKHLIDQFKKYVGLSPKYYQRILRFNDLMAKIQQKELVTWAEVAYECGFSDQAHFIREFQHFSGFNPSEFINEEFDDGRTNFFPLDREG